MNDIKANQYFKEISDKLEAFYTDILKLLHDEAIIHLIGNKSYEEFELQVLLPLQSAFNQKLIGVVGKLGGHDVSLIRWYCDKFNQNK